MGQDLELASGVNVDEISKTYLPSPRWMKMLVKSNIKEPVVALDRVSFNVGPGEICAVVGPNGAGKTTTFRILVGLTTASSGEARIMDLDCGTQSVAVRGLVGWMPAEDRSLIMRLSCAENLHFHGRLQGLRGEHLRSRIRSVLDQVGILHAAESSVFALSAGMRARLQLARALLADPKVLILDEPTGSVDPVASHDLLNLILRIVDQRGLAVLISSHRLEEIEALHSHAILLDKGRLRFDGDLDELRRRYDRRTLELEFSSISATRSASRTLRQSRLGEIVSESDTAVHLILPNDAQVGEVLTYLNSRLDEIVRVHELNTPLRDLLARMYGSDHSATRTGK